MSITIGNSETASPEFWLMLHDDNGTSYWLAEPVTDVWQTLTVSLTSDISNCKLPPQATVVPVAPTLLSNIGDLDCLPAEKRACLIECISPPSTGDPTACCCRDESRCEPNELCDCGMTPGPNVNVNVVG